MLGRPYSLFSDEFTEPATKQALVDDLLMSGEGAWARADLRVAQALVELSERARGFVNEIPGRQLSGSVGASPAPGPRLDAAPRQPARWGARRSDHPAGTGRHGWHGARGRGPGRARQFRDTGAIRTGPLVVVLADPARLTEAVKWESLTLSNACR